MVRANPAAYWLTASPSASNANRLAANIAASIATMAATKAECPPSATPKAVAAPISIMPSMPRFMTPERSTRSSPMAAKISGVAATRVPLSSGISRLMP